MTPEEKPEPAPGRPAPISQISTIWSDLGDPLQFVQTYGAAIRRYLLALLMDQHEAEDVFQELLLQVTANGFPHADPNRGRFRDYLKTIVRNAARARLKRASLQTADDLVLDQLPAESADPAEQIWPTEWRQCMLSRVWSQLERHQQEARGNNLTYLVLRLSVDHPEEDSRQLAARASAQIGQPLNSAAFRKQLSRARHLFAELIAEEVRQTLRQPTTEQLKEELAQLNLLHYLRDFLPPDAPPRFDQK